MLGGVPIGKAIQIVTFAFLGELLKMRGVHGSLINSLCSPEVCINGTASQLFTGVVLDDSPVGTLLTPGSYSRFHDVSSRALANPGFSVDQQAGLVVAQLSPMIAYPRPVYQDQPQLIGEDFSKPNTPVASFLLAEGYHAAFGIGGTVKVLAHDSCPNMKQWSLKGLELMSVESSNCPGGCGSGGSCSSSTSACQCKTGYSGPRCGEYIFPRDSDLMQLEWIFSLSRLIISASILSGFTFKLQIHVPKGSLDPTVSPAPTVKSRRALVTMAQLARDPASPSI